VVTPEVIRKGSYFTGGTTHPEMVIRCPERPTYRGVSPPTVGTAHDGGIRSVPFHGEAGQPSCHSLSGPVGICRPFLHSLTSRNFATASVSFSYQWSLTAAGVVRSSLKPLRAWWVGQLRSKDLQRMRCRGSARSGRSQITGIEHSPADLFLRRHLKILAPRRAARSPVLMRFCYDRDSPPH
jgi:hypothetical protein